MNRNKSIKIKKSTFSLCIPITPRTVSEVSEQIKKIRPSLPDFMEWRRDHMREISINEEKEILSTMGEYHIPLIYTYRSHHEGGVTFVSEEDRLERILLAMNSSSVAYVDVELNNPSYFLEAVFKEREKSNCGVILSTHCFERCYTTQELEALFRSMILYRPDVIKIAHTPLNIDEAETATKAVEQYDRQMDLPIIYVLMGDYGQASRVFPEDHGGSLTYAVGEETTAPGQLSVEQILFLRKNAN